VKGAASAEVSGYRSTKRVLYFPDDEDFFELRNLNFRHNADEILKKLNHPDVAARKAYRGLVTRELTSDQAAQLMAGLEHVLSQAVLKPESPEARSVYSICVLLGERFERAGAVPVALTSIPPEDTNLSHEKHDEIPEAAHDVV
jgi:hypothetical protein